MILGSGGHAASLIDILERENKYKIAGYVVNDKKKECCIKYPQIGKDRDLDCLYQNGIKNAAIGVGYLGKSDLRKRLYERLKKIGFNFPVICDPSAMVSSHTEIGEGTMIGKGAIINVGTKIGKMCIINSGAIVEHDCIVDDFTHIAVGGILCGSVTVGRSTFIGANTTVIQEKTIGRNCVIGAGITIKKNIGDCNMVWDIENRRGMN